MTIHFLKDYSVGTPPEHFAAGDTVKGRSPESEAHFVRRGVAAYVGDKGALLNFDGNVIGKLAKGGKAAPVSADDGSAAVDVVVNTADSHAEGAEDGAPEGASSGPGDVVTSDALGAGAAGSGQG